MKRRVFVAIPVPERVRLKIAAWQRAHADIPVRWTKPENLHITVIPPWYVNEDEIAFYPCPLQAGKYTIVAAP